MIRTTYIFLLASILYLFTGSPLSAEEQINYRFQYLKIEEGLPQNTINCIEQDKYGFIWIGTNNGVCRYDAYNFETYQSDESIPDNLPDNLIRSIRAGSDNLIWIGSSKGLSYYEHFTNKMTHFRQVIDPAGKISKVSSIITFRNEVWVATETQGIYHLVKENGSYKIKERFCVENHNLPHNHINVIYRDSDYHLYAGSETGYFLLNDAQTKFVRPKAEDALPPNTYINDIFVDSHGNQYFSTFNGLFVRFYREKNFTWFSPDISAPKALNHGTVNSVTEGISGQIYVASFGGLQKFNIEQRNFSDFPLEGPENLKINNAFINVVYCDENGNVWVGTEKGGINKFNVFQNSINYFRHDPNKPNSLSHSTVNSVFSEKNSLWIGTAGGGLNHYNKTTQQFKHYRNQANNSKSLSSDFVTSIVRGSNNILYVGTWGSGLNALKTSNGSVQIKPIRENDPHYKSSLSNSFISCLLDNQEHYLLIGTEGGLALLDYRTNKFTNLLAPDNAHYDLTEVGCLLLDSKGFYWVGTRNGLFRFPHASLYASEEDNIVLKQLEFYKHEPNQTNSLPGDYIISLMEDAKGNIWIGTHGNGLVKTGYQETGKLHFKTYTKEDGLANNVIYGILEDANQKIWVSTDFGISVLNTINNSIRNFFKQDGLLSNQFYWSAAHKSTDGTLYFGGTEGLNYFIPEDFYDYNYFPNPRLTQMRIFNQEVAPKSTIHKKEVLTKPIYDVDTIFLSYKDNNISFDFSSFDYYQPQKSQYQYMLDGVDEKWITVSAQRRYVSYNNLSGGTYTFLLKAANCDGLWSNNISATTIIIYPPFWRTTWFQILSFILVSLLLYLFIRLQMQRIIAQKRILEQKVKERTQQIQLQNSKLEEQTNILMDSNLQLEGRQKQIEHQKEELETKTEEILKQRDELILLNEKVNEINQMQLRFFTNISHEFQTPLTLIISPIERLMKKLHADKETTQVLSIINRNANRLLLLIKDLLDIRKVETGNQVLQVELTDMNPFLLDIFNAFQNLAKKNEIRYSHSIEVHKPCWIDKTKVENVLYNLLSNAFKYTPKNRSINLKAYLDKQDTLVFAVQDTGDGIASDKLDKLFDRFYQVTDNRAQKQAGTGIGLSMVKSLTEIMYGEVQVESEVGKGTVFTVRLAVNKTNFKEEEFDKTGQIFASTIHNKVAVLSEKINEPEHTIEYINEDASVEKILVVEDNNDMRSFICSSLAQYYSVFEAENGEVGYKIAQKEMPAIIITDIMMPVVNGLELCKKVKNNLYTSHIPIIMLTARANTEDHLEGLALGADDYITKPFNIEILLAKIKTLVDNRNKLKAKFGRLEDVKPEEIKVSNLDSKFFEKANEIVNKYYAEAGFDVDQFASEMFVSRSQLYSKLKAITNLSANEFINTFRLKKSIELLQKNEMQISEIAYAVGFNDPKYFSRIFKKYYKVSPSEYLKQ